MPKCQTSEHPLALLDSSPSIQSNARQRRFLRVEASMKIAHLKKWIKLKFGLPYNQRVVLLFDNEILPDSYQMVDLAYIFSKTVSEDRSFVLDSTKESLSVQTLVCPTRFAT